MFLGSLSFLLVSFLTAQIEVNFEESGQTVDESGSIIVIVSLSEASALEISVPYVVNGASTAQNESDYEIPEDNADNNFFNESPMVFAPGETVKTIRINIVNDLIEEDDELLILELVQDGLVEAQIGERNLHTIRIIDNDPTLVHFDTQEEDFYENANIVIPVRLNAPLEEDLNVSFSITPVTANDADYEANHDGTATSESPITILAGSTLGQITIDVKNDSVTDRNDGGADRETLEVRLTSASLDESGTVVDVDGTPYTATIIDNDPLTVEIDFEPFDDEVQPYEIEEYEIGRLTINLVDPEGNLSSAGDEIEIPISFSGGAVRGDGDNDDYDSEDGPIEITAGQSTFTYSIAVNNDDAVEEDEIVTVTLGNPAYQDGGDVLLDPENSISFLIKDNDPITLNFGAIFSRDDEEASENDDVENVIFVDSAGSLVAEGQQSVQIPYYLSSISANDVEFDLEIVSSGTTATIFDSSLEDQDWDYLISQSSLTKVDEKQRVTMRGGFRNGVITVLLNDDDETPIVLGESPAADVEPDETVQFRITNLNTSDSKVNLGISDYTLTIQEKPDIDVTHLFTGTSPDSSQFVGGFPKFDDRTGLIELHYLLTPTTTFNSADFAGYNSLKATFRTSNYDGANRDSETNDPVISNPINPQDGESYQLVVDSPFQLRYASGIDLITLSEGVEPENDSTFIDANADVVEFAQFILKPLNLPRLNDFEAIVDDGYDINEPSDWTVDLASRAFFRIPLDRIDPAINPHRFKLYLTTDATQVLAGNTGNVLQISNFEPQPDGSMLLMITTGGSNSLQIQYLDAGEEWKVVQPTSISTGGASRLYWLDRGPPQTRSHPSEESFRLYRVIQN